MAVNLGQRYADAIHQLLPKGPAWQEKGICTETLLGRWIRGNAEELARFQVWFDTLLKWSIERYSEMPTGWSADDYEALIKNKFGLDVTVTPNASADDPHLPTVSERNRYYFAIDISDDDLSAINNLFTGYLDQYKQSHTDYFIRTQSQSSLPAAPRLGLYAQHIASEVTLSANIKNKTGTGLGFIVQATQLAEPIVARFVQHANAQPLKIFNQVTA